MVTLTKTNDKKSMAKKSAVQTRAVAKTAPGKDGKAEVDAMLDAHPTLKTTVAQIEKQFGEGAIMPLGAGTGTKSAASPPAASRSIWLWADKVFPVDAWWRSSAPNPAARPRWPCTWSPSRSAGGIAAFIDAEHALDPSWAKKLGVELETLLVSQPGSGEEAMHITEMLIRSNAVDVIVIDSVAALVPKKELEGDIGDSHVGLQARLMSQSLRKLTGAISKSKTAVIFINQIREKIGVMFGSPETTPGGRALKFYSSCRIDVRRIGQLKEGEEVIGQRVRAKVVKNKVAPPFRVAEFDMMHADGISYEGDILDLAIEDKLIVRTGAWFRYGDVQLGQGREKTRDHLRENPALLDELKAKIIAARGQGDPPPAKSASDEEETVAEVMDE